ncbi:hypothetical protein [Hymenobacter baengnokdamensis]|uniref:hypothetical protein n=1 Tax=Hymenobacter baengnokdamensis TaxID=2615203 RepID=UPI0012492DF3|nr:hypothetical protein [Hymenobacter baengnokdamensis]
MVSPQNSPLFRFTLNSELLGPWRLRYDPVDWDTLAVTLSRARNTHGIDVEYSTHLGFVKDGKAYLQQAFDAADIEANVTLTVEQWEPNNFVWQLYYYGQVVFLAAEFTLTQINVNLAKVGYLQRFLSRDSVSVDLFAGTSVSGFAGAPAPLMSVELHSRAIMLRYAASQQNEVVTTSAMYGDNGDPSHEQLLYFGFDTPELNELNLGAVGGGFVPGDATSAVAIYTAQGKESVTITLALFARVEAHTENGLFIRQFTKVGCSCFLRVTGLQGGTTLLQPEIAVGHLNGDYVGQIAVPAQLFRYELEAGDEVFLFADWFVHDLTRNAPDPYQATITAVFQPGSFLRITADTQTTPTPTNGVLAYEALNRVCQALTDEVDVFRSDFFGRTDSTLAYPVDGPGSLTLLTGGFQVRGFPLLTDPGPTGVLPDLRKSLFTTWSDLFGSLAAVYCLGNQFEWVIGQRGQPVQVVRVEPASYFYDTEIVLDLGPVTDARIHVAEENYYQVVEMNYEQWQAEQVNGLVEFNSKRQWTTPLTQVSNTYIQSSKFAAAGILLETTRRQRYLATSTTDDARDTTNFLVCLVRQGGSYTTERDQQLLTSTGLFSPETVYNLRLSPARMLRRHSAIIRAGLMPIPLNQVRFTSGEGNTTLVSQLAGEAAPIAEGGDVAVTDLDQPLWRGLTYTFTAPVSRAQHQALLTNPKGRVRLSTEKGKVLIGWVLEYKHTASSQLADFTLLACAS